MAQEQVIARANCVSSPQVSAFAPTPATSTKCVFSIDVEDWFHILDIPSTPPLTDWNSLPSRVEINFLRLLDLFGQKEVHVTCFFLGWVAQKFPYLVREASRRGHEVASHGYAHRLAYEMTPPEFFLDIWDTKKTLEDVSGHEVWGYRSPGFSVTERTPWFFETLMEAGYRYDASVFPAARAHGGLRTDSYGPYVVIANSHSLVEFPITVAKVFGEPICFFGGGYLRLFPYYLVKKMTLKVLAEGRPVMFYVHPREIDPGHPRLAMNLLRKFKSYVNLGTMEKKIHRLLSEFEFVTYRDLLSGERVYGC